MISGIKEEILAFFFFFIKKFSSEEELFILICPDIRVLVLESNLGQSHRTFYCQ